MYSVSKIHHKIRRDISPKGCPMWTSQVNIPVFQQSFYLFLQLKEVCNTSLVTQVCTIKHNNV